MGASQIILIPTDKLSGYTISMFSQNRSKKLVLFAVGFFLLNLILKLINIHTTPPGFAYDEIVYITEARSILAYGTDITGTWNPIDLAPSDGMYTELTSSVLVPGFILFPNDVILASKIVPIVLGSLLPVLLALITYFFSKRTWAFIGTAIVATFNPWIFQFSRMGFDSIFSVVFYTLGITLVLYLKGWWKVLSLAAFFLGFFQYQGHKPVLVPLVGLSVLFLYLYSNHKIKIKELFKQKQYPLYVILGGALIIVASYIIRLPQLTSSVRSEEFSLTSQTEIAHTVNENRRLSLTNPFSSFIDNKYTILLETLFNRFLASFDTRLLFIEGNKAVDTFSVTEYGYFHLLDSVLLILGVILLKGDRKWRFSVIYILCWIIIGTIPNVLRSGTSWIIFRCAFVFIGLVMLAGVGFGELLEKVSPKLRYVVLGLYLLNAVYFLYIYFNRYPLTETVQNGFYERVLASYVLRQPEKQFIILPDRPDATFDYMLSYNSLLTAANKEKIYSAAANNIFKLENFSLEYDCPIDRTDIVPESVLVVELTRDTCRLPSIPSSNFVTEINSLTDSGTRFRIYNDTLCSSFDLPTYPNVKDNIFDVENLSDEQFCETFFTKRPTPTHNN